MCLAVPAKVIEVDGDEALADLHGNRVRVTTVLVPGLAVGDWILMHAGFAIQQLDAESARRTWSVLSDLSDAASEELADMPEPTEMPEPNEMPGLAEMPGRTEMPELAETNGGDDA